MQRTHSSIMVPLLTLVLWVVPGAGFANDAPSFRRQASDIINATGVQGGLVVQFGCGDGRLTAAMLASDSCLVHGLDADAANVAKAREYIRSLGLYGKVSVEQWTDKTLPYIDNLVNLVVSEDLGDVPMAEVMRVLAPEGVAYVKSGGKWSTTVKPRPEEIDEWTHFRRFAQRTARSSDSMRWTPPRCLMA